MSWVPGRLRAARALESPFEDIPDHLMQPLWDWITASLGRQYGVDRTEAIAIDLRVGVAGGENERFRELHAQFNEDRQFGLDLIEALLERYGWDSGHARLLQEVLSTGNSAYAVRDDWGGLELRVAPGVKEVVSRTASDASRAAGQHLVNAWNEAFGRRTDPAKSYDESIKAVEAAIGPIISPKDDSRTLTKMINALRDAPAKWSFAVADERGPRSTGAPADGVQVVLEMLRLLAYGQKQRHGSDSGVETNSQEQAQAAVMIAVTIVQWAAAGALARSAG